MVIPHSSKPVFGQRGVAEALHIGEAVCLNSKRTLLPEGSIEVEDGIWIRCRSRRIRITFGSSAARTVLRILVNAADLVSIPAPARHGVDNEGNFIRHGRGKRLDINGRRTSTASRGLQGLRVDPGQRGRQDEQSASLPNDNQVLKFRGTANL